MQWWVEGADRKEYGPIDLSTLQRWVSEGRVIPTTRLRDEHGTWGVAGEMSELFSPVIDEPTPSPLSGPPPTVAPIEQAATEPVQPLPRGSLVPPLRGPASWLYAVGILSLINMVLLLTNAQIHFPVGLATSEIGAALWKSKLMVVRFGGVGVGTVLAAMYLPLGYFAARGNVVAFVVGLVVLVLDTMLYLIALDTDTVISIGFHLYACYRIFQGLTLTRNLRKAGYIL